MYLIQNFKSLTVNAQLTRINLPSETRTMTSYAGQSWQHVDILLWFFGIKYKQGTIIYLFASYVVSSCSPLAMAPHSLGTHPKLTLVSSETKWFHLRLCDHPEEIAFLSCAMGCTTGHPMKNNHFFLLLWKQQRTRLVAQTVPWQVKDSGTQPAFLFDSLSLKSHTPKMSVGKMNV